MSLKENRKTPNLLIREKVKKSSRQIQLEGGKTKTSFMIHDKKKTSNKSIITEQNIKTQKQLTQAEYLTQQEQIKVIKQAQKIVKKKVKGSQAKIESEMVTLLEQQCAKIGLELEKERFQSNKRKCQIDNLRQNIQHLNKKLEKMFDDRQNLATDNNYGKMKKEQLSQELHTIKISLKRKQDLMGHEIQKRDQTITELRSALQNQGLKIDIFQEQLIKQKTEKEQIKSMLDEKTYEAQYLRQNFEQRKKQWDRFRKNIEGEATNKLNKKAQKISKLQGQLDKAQEKIRDEENLRKKLLEKQRELQKQVSKKSSQAHTLDDQVSGMKKRINDLSILKSSNNTILNEKVTKLLQENQALRNQISSLKGSKKINNNIQEKPMLFGTSDFD